MTAPTGPSMTPLRPCLYTCIGLAAVVAADAAAAVCQRSACVLLLVVAPWGRRGDTDDWRLGPVGAPMATNPRPTAHGPQAAMFDRQPTSLVLHHRGSLRKDHKEMWVAGKTSELTGTISRTAKMPNVRPLTVR